MPYVLRDIDGRVSAVSASEVALSGWEKLDAGAPEYLDYLEAAINKEGAFRESDIQLARVLEDLIDLLTDRDLIHFTDFPVAAQKRLIDRQNLRKSSKALDFLVTEGGDDAFV